MISAKQIRAARLFLEWEQRGLAEKSGLSLPTIQRMEKFGVERSSAANADKVQKALEVGGIEFIPENGGGEGVRMRTSRWFLEVYANNQGPPQPAEYFADFASLFTRLKELKSHLSEADTLRVHLPASATREERDAIAAIGGVST